MTYYLILFLITIVCFVVYWLVWDRNYSILYTLTVSIIVLSNLGFLLRAMAKDIPEYLVANKIIYIGGCYLLMLVMFYIAEMCHISFPKWLKCVFAGINSIFYLGAFLAGIYPVFYKEITSHMENGMLIVDRTYAPLHTCFHYFCILEFLISFGILIYAFYKIPQASRRNIMLLFISQTISMAAFFIGKELFSGKELLPIAYIIDMIIYTFIAERTSLYDINNVAGDSLTEQDNIGFILLDENLFYLGCNEAAYTFIPDLIDQRVDAPLLKKGKISELAAVLDHLKGHDKGATSHTVEIDDHFINYDIDYLYVNGKEHGYRVMITDVTSQQKYLRLLNEYNDTLTAEVEKKTKHIQILNDSFVLGMATLVESRDNSTGGHIRRTSDVVEILMEEMEKSSFVVNKTFIRNMIKAAPMHDLGKIAVDDVILRKPGRFTPEEFEKMKIHAAEGAKVVRKVLSDTDDEEFKSLAENVAHYHHERWDGSGYPEGLKGDAIPLEARIMAIADVYDALVSKRCYKESMSFEEAYDIIMKGMGTHFDKRLEPYFVNVREKLEAYYSEQE